MIIHRTVIFVFQVERFWLQTNMVLCVMIGVGYTTLMRLLRYLSSGKSAVHTLATWLSALLIVYAQWVSLAPLQQKIDMENLCRDWN